MKNGDKKQQSVILLSHFVSLLVLISATVPSSVAEAQDTASPTTIDEIIVTATKREQSVQDVALSLSVLDEASLSASRLDGFKEAQRFIPSLNFTEFGSADRNGTHITIRGVANTRITGSSDNVAALTTAYLIDEVALTPFDTRFFDVARIEVLNGPQGTLWGSASMGGTVKVIFNKPDSTNFSAKIRADGYATQHASPGSRFDAMVNIPLIEDKLAVRGSAFYRSEGGFIDVRDPGLSADRVEGEINFPGANLGDIQLSQLQNVRTNANSMQSWGGRVSVGLIASDKLELEGALMYQSNFAPDANFVHRNLSTPYYRVAFLPDPREEEFFLASLTARYQLPFAELVSVSAFFTRDIVWSQDVTGLAAAIFGNTADGGIAARSGLGFARGESSFSQEIRLQSTSEFSRINWVAGAYFLTEDRYSEILWDAPGFNENVDPAFGISHSENLIIAGEAVGGYENISFFADVTYDITDKLSISAGARHYDHELDETAYFGGVFSAAAAEGEIAFNPPYFTSSDGWTPRLSVAYQISSDVMVYASAAEGFRLGGDNNSPLLQTIPECGDAADKLGIPDIGAFESDSLENYEVGAKTSWAEKFIVNVAAFYIDWSEMQTNINLNQFELQCVVTATANVGSASIQGFEATFIGHLTDRWEVGAIVSQNDAKFDAPPPGVTLFQEGQAIPQVPEWKFGATVQYNFPVMGRAGYVRGEWNFVDSFETIGFQPDNPDPFFQVDSTSVFNLRTGVEFGEWDGAIYVENVFDEVIVNHAQIQVGEAHNQVFVGRPLTAGIIVQRRF